MMAEQIIQEAIHFEILGRVWPDALNPKIVVGEFAIAVEEALVVAEDIRKHSPKVSRVVRQRVQNGESTASLLACPSSPIFGELLEQLRLHSLSAVVPPIF